MARRNFDEGYLQIPGEKESASIQFTGAIGNINVNCDYSIYNNTASLYIPSTNALAVSNGTINVQLPANLIPSKTIDTICSVIQGTSETIGKITISNIGVLNIYATITGTPFSQGSNCGTFSGQTITYNLN